MKNVIAIVALLACGIVKGEAAELTPAQQDECLQRAQTAMAVVHARDGNQPREKLLNYVAANEPAIHQPTFNRIINNVYNNPKTTKSAAYNGEYTYCFAHIVKETKQRVAAR